MVLSCVTHFRVDVTGGVCVFVKHPPVKREHRTIRTNFWLDACHPWRLGYWYQNNITQAHPPCNVWDLTYIKTHIFAIYYHISSTHNNIWYTSPTWTFFATVTIPFVWRSHFPPRNVDQPFSLWEEAKAGGTKSSCPGNRVHGLETYQQKYHITYIPLEISIGGRG